MYQQKIQPCAPCPVLHVEPAIQRRIAQQPRPHGWMVRQIMANGNVRVDTHGRAYLQISRLLIR